MTNQVNGQVLADGAPREPALQVRDLRKVFKVKAEDSRRTEDLVAVDGVSFELPASGSLGIVGESGSGKTTVARIIAGLERPTSGTVVVAGAPLQAKRLRGAARRARGRRVQMVFQDPYSSLDPRQTVGDCLDELLRFHTSAAKPARRERTLELLSQVGLDQRHETLRPRSLSGGQRQRVAIARALACDPEVLILDEAVSALDVSVQGQVLNLLADLRAELRVAYLFVSHDLAVVQQVTDDTIVMHRGRIEESGPTDTILREPASDYTRELLAAVPRPGWQPLRRSRSG
ncbi:MAG: ATP-binding cassette domain-containing protein [Nocardiopsaceae bacterium]|jgi:peptide/nickel transport system ATP-binding protein|nr:ATP-binding cassette domain-containing protein [Nocardiopsaceae bacterium]